MNGLRVPRLLLRLLRAALAVGVVGADLAAKIKRTMPPCRFNEAKRRDFNLKIQEKLYLAC